MKIRITAFVAFLSVAFGAAAQEQKLRDALSTKSGQPPGQWMTGQSKAPDGSPIYSFLVRGSPGIGAQWGTLILIYRGGKWSSASIGTDREVGPKNSSAKVLLVADGVTSAATCTTGDGQTLNFEKPPEFARLLMRSANVEIGFLPPGAAYAVGLNFDVRGFRKALAGSPPEVRKSLDTEQTVSSSATPSPETKTGSHPAAAGENAVQSSTAESPAVFVENFVKDLGSNDPDIQLPYYAEPTRYYDSKRVDNATIRKDLKDDITRWPNRIYSIGDTPKISPTDNGFIAEFPMTYTLTSKNGVSSGTLQMTLHVKLQGQSPQIIEIRKEVILARQPNTMKSRPSALESKLVGIKWFSGISKSGRYVIVEYTPDHRKLWAKTSTDLAPFCKWHLEGNELLYTELPQVNPNDPYPPAKRETIVEVTKNTLTLKEHGPNDYTYTMRRLTKADLAEIVAPPATVPSQQSSPASTAGRDKAAIEAHTTLKADVEIALGKSNRNVARVWDVQVTGQTITVRFSIDDNLTSGLIKSSAMTDIQRILKAVHSASYPYSEISVVGTFHLKDQFGNSSEDEVVRVTFKRSTVDRINWDGFETGNIYKIADNVWLVPAFQ